MSQTSIDSQPLTIESDIKINAFATIEKEYSTEDIRRVYKFHKLIGSGSFGSVRLASLIDSPEKLYAIKSLRRDKISKDAEGQLLNEIRSLESMDHQSIVKFHGCYIDKRYVHLVLDHCAGGELFDRVKEETFLSENSTAIVMKQLLSAIEHMHQKGVCHRDLKPENIMLNNPSNLSDIKVLDLGLSKKFEEGEE